MIVINSKGSFKKTFSFLNKLSKYDIKPILERYGEFGVRALRDATPVDSGTTASSWGYYVETDSDTSRIVWENSNVVKGVNIAIILQYGHATKNGGYVQGLDYINPALMPVFDELAENLWKEVSGL